jgi:hypothetical protein
MVAAFKVLRIHSETVIPLALAVEAIRLISSVLNRTGTIRPLASPLREHTLEMSGKAHWLHDFAHLRGLASKRMKAEDGKTGRLIGFDIDQL